jgi:hypothetical protein
LVYDRKFHDAVAINDFGYEKYDESDYMDIGSPTTVFISSIDEFLKDEDEGEEHKELINRRFLGIPSPLSGYPDRAPHFYEWPSKAIMPYIPQELVIWRHLFGSAKCQEAEEQGDEPVMDVEYEDGQDSMEVD